MIHHHHDETARVAHLVIDRPERRNALDTEALDQFAMVLAEVASDAAEQRTRAVVLSGTGGHFCAGADLTGVEDQAFTAELQLVLHALASLPLPTIAAVQGAALGAGTQVAIACDLRVAAQDSSFGIPAAKLGLMVNNWTVRRLTDTAGASAARAMLVAAEVYRGDRLFASGFVHRLAARAEVVAEALAWAAELASLAPLTMAGHKLVLDRQLAGAADDDPDSLTAFDTAWSSEDKNEGVTAFQERRAARFEGR